MVCWCGGEVVVRWCVGTWKSGWLPSSSVEAAEPLWMGLAVVNERRQTEAEDARRTAEEEGGRGGGRGGRGEEDREALTAERRLSEVEKEEVVEEEEEGSAKG